MKFTTSVKALKTAVNTVSKCISSKPLMPILAGIKLDYDGELVVTGYNLAEGMQVICETESGELGSIVILEKDLSALLGKLSGTIECEVKGLVAKFTTEYSQIELSGLDPSEYPELIFHLESDEKSTAQLPVKSFTDAIAKCSQSSSTAEDKQLLQGVNIKASEGVATLASTDGHRLTVCTVPCDADIGSITISSKFLSQLPKSIAENIHLTVEGNQVLITDETGNSSIARVYDGMYPKYELLLPKSFTRTLAVNRLQLIELLSVAEIACSATNLVELKLKPTELSIHTDRDSAKATSKMECKLDGGLLNIGFNLKYLVQGLKIFEDETIQINLNGALEPITIVSLDGSTTHLIMPVQIRK